MNHEFDSQENEALNKANTKLAPKNMFFSRSWSLSDHLCLVIAYASIGYFDTISRLLQLLVNNENYILESIASVWAKQQDTQQAKKKKGSKHQEQRQCDQQKEKKLSRKIGLIIKQPKKLVIFMSMDMQFQFLIRIFRLILIQINRKLIIWRNDLLDFNLMKWLVILSIQKLDNIWWF